MPEDQLIQYLNSFQDISPEDRLAISQRMQPRRVKKKQILLAAGDSCNHCFFVAEGCLKMYMLDLNAKEHNIHFSAENEWAIDIGSFYTAEASQVYIEAIEPTLLLQMAKDDLVHLVEHYPSFNRVYRKVVENVLVKLERRLLQTFSSSADGRYHAFVQEYPHLANRLPNTQIASFIGITPESLSRIKNQLANQ
jgi:CRP-like cAMP-binding protein